MTQLFTPYEFFITSGTHPEFEERLQQIIDKREQMLEQHALALNYQRQCIQKEYEAETLRLEESYQVRMFIVSCKIDNISNNFDICSGATSGSQ